MANSSDMNVKRFHIVAKRHYEDGKFLLLKNRTNGAVYLAGYAVECVFKALILHTTPISERESVAKSFRGSGYHNYENLKVLYREQGGSLLPSEIVKCFATVNTWEVAMRYNPKKLEYEYAKSFIINVRIIINWAEGRLK